MQSREEAAAYLAHEVLGPRLHQCAQLVVRSGAVNANTLMGGFPDDRKLRSSMTLFAEVAKNGGDDADFVAVMLKYFRGERDANTLRLLQSASAATPVEPQNPPTRKGRRRWWPFSRCTD
ncbi:DUF1810 family protein [Mycolicibacterium gadium]|uniref:DUF1810 family protein n=1 Tax=Mycolicibacterium gadium TaxID=1794 RepID=UPI0035565546